MNYYMGNVAAPTSLPEGAIRCGQFWILHITPQRPLDTYAVVVTKQEKNKTKRFVDALYHAKELADSHGSMLCKLSQYAQTTIETVKIEQAESLQQIKKTIGTTTIMQADKEPDHVFVALSPFIF